MRMSRLFLYTLFQDPQDAEIISHKLMLRAGLVRKLAAGIYSYLPLGFRVLIKVINIVREEMDAIGAQEVLLPALQPASLWEETGRWQTYGEDMFKLLDRKKTPFGLGPTHEEIITDLVRKEVKSYRQLPLFLYQIQTKFRDEPRPRFGMIRGREFLMKDAYSFHPDDKNAEESYQKFYDAYTKIFTRCGLKFKIIEAESGLIGGTFSHEFMASAPSGEDKMVTCNKCDYAANLEKAECGIRQGTEDSRQEAEDIGQKIKDLELVDTPGMKTVEEVSSFLKISPSQLVKTLIYKADAQVIGVLIGGDYEVNESKLRKVIGAKELILADPKTIEQITKAPIGFAGPIGVKEFPLIADVSIQTKINFVVGGNKKDAHYINANFERDFKMDKFVDIKVVHDQDLCPNCSDGKLNINPGIELGHTFKLGTKYSTAMSATFLDEKGQEKPLIMGCYGIGVSRIIPTYIEQNHDERGIIWQTNIAPYEVLILPINVSDSEQRTLAEEIYELLLKEKIEVLLDDRDERPGRKFTDADLIGIPIQIIIGAKTKSEGLIEFCYRRTKEKEFVPLENLVSKIKDNRQ
ncbi:MAG: proline--tRNA ligase [Nitrospirota bacterium]